MKQLKMERLLRKLKALPLNRLQHIDANALGQSVNMDSSEIETFFDELIDENVAVKKRIYFCPFCGEKNTRYKRNEDVICRECSKKIEEKYETQDVYYYINPKNLYEFISSKYPEVLQDKQSGNKHLSVVPSENKIKNDIIGTMKSAMGEI